MARAQLNSQVTTQMQHSSLASRVPVGSLLTQRADPQTRHTRRDEHTTRVRMLSSLLQQGGENPNGVEDGFDVEVHDLGKGLVWVGVETFTPGGARVGEEDVDLVGVLADGGEERVDTLHVGGVGGDGDGDGAGGAVGEFVEGFAGFFAGGGLAGGDEDHRGASLHESKKNIWLVSSVSVSPRARIDVLKGVLCEHGKLERTYADAACRPRPRDPPVTTATLPLREKSEGKSASWACARASSAMMVMCVDVWS